MRAARATALISLALLAAAAPSAQGATPLQAPTGVYGEATRADAIEINWSSGNDPPTAGQRYTILRDGNSIGSTFGTSFTDEWLLGAHLYEYVVRVTNSAGESADSQTIRVPTPEPEVYEAEPYLQRLQPSSAAVVWQTFEPSVTGLDLSVLGGSRPTTIAHETRLRRRHVVLLRNLQPETLYTYTWQSGGVTGTGSFRTPPANPARFDFDVIGDFGTNTTASAINLARINKGNADFALTVGDNAYPNATASQYVNYVLNPLHDFLTSKPFWTSVGNHDYMGLHNYERFFDFPGDHLYYRFRYGPVEFVQLDSNSFGPKQRAWALRALARSRATCKVVFFHHPIWSSGRGNSTPGRKARQRAFVPILQGGGADLVLNGHVHNYERSRPLWSGRVSRRRGITYVVTGGGGAELGGFVTRRKPRWSASRGVYFQRTRYTYSDSDGAIFGRSIDTAGKVRDRFRATCRQ